MGHEHVYGICENKCMVEVATKKETPYVENEESELQLNVIIQPAGKWFDGEHEISRIYIPTSLSDWTFVNDYISSTTAMSASLYNKIDWSKVLSGFIYVNYRGPNSPKKFVLPIEVQLISNQILVYAELPYSFSSGTDVYIVIEAVLKD